MAHKILIRPKSLARDSGNEPKVDVRLPRVSKLKLFREQRKQRSAVRAETSQRADLSLLEPYNWGSKGEPKGQPFRYVPGKGWGTHET